MIRVLYLRRLTFEHGSNQGLSKASWALAELCSEYSQMSTMVDLGIPLSQETLGYRYTVRRST
jgi:hypothetical protein